MIDAYAIYLHNEDFDSKAIYIGNGSEQNLHIYKEKQFIGINNYHEKLYSYSSYPDIIYYNIPNPELKYFYNKWIEDKQQDKIYEIYDHISSFKKVKLIGILDGSWSKQITDKNILHIILQTFKYTNGFMTWSPIVRDLLSNFTSNDIKFAYFPSFILLDEMIKKYRRFNIGEIPSNNNIIIPRIPMISVDRVGLDGLEISKYCYEKYNSLALCILSRNAVTTYERLMDKANDLSIINRKSFHYIRYKKTENNYNWNLFYRTFIGNAKILVFLDAYITFGRLVLDSAIVGIPSLGYQTTMQSTLYPKELTVDLFDIKQLKYNIDRLMNDKKYYIDMCKYRDDVLYDIYNPSKWENNVRQWIDKI